MAAILTPPVRVKEESCCRPVRGVGTLQGRENELFVHGVRHMEPNDFFSKNIFYSGEIQPTFICGNIGYVADPHAVRGLLRELSIQYIVRHRLFVI